ncbi:MAG TPA: hypothetical protein O0X45_05385, partial [Methanocorpusculum sp.]|nr:hypothetical protein [Methanocorpusculum sp.]
GSGLFSGQSGMSRQLVWVCWQIHVDGIGITPVFLLGHPVQRATRSCRSETSVGGMRSWAMSPVSVICGVGFLHSVI